MPPKKTFAGLFRIAGLVWSRFRDSTIGSREAKFQDTTLLLLAPEERFRLKRVSSSHQMNLLVLVSGLTILPSAVLATPDFVPTASAYHAYIDAKVILSFELTLKEEIFVEVVNMGDIRRCLSIENISMRTEDGKVLQPDSFLYDGSKSKTDGGDKACTRQRTRRKWELGYSFDFPERVRKVVFLMGNQAFRLQPVSAAEFEEFLENVDRLNIGVASEYLKIFDLRVKFGRNIYGSSVRYRKVNISPTSDGTREPITLLSTIPKQTEQALKKKKGGEVEVSVKLDAKGEVIEANAGNFLEFGLTERAVYEVKNWWDFAPAFENGKPVPSTHTAKVVYRVEEPDED
jgi:hypothetical protein